MRASNASKSRRAHAVLKADQAQPLKVTAFFNDGHEEDVTRWTKYTAGNTSRGHGG